MTVELQFVNNRRSSKVNPLDGLFHDPNQSKNMPGVVEQLGCGSILAQLVKTSLRFLLLPRSD